MFVRGSCYEEQKTHESWHYRLLITHDSSLIAMRWSIRYQLLVPLLLLLAGIAGISAWTAMASAKRARHQIESQVRNVARTLSESNIPVAPNWLGEMQGLSGAEY